ncbi:MAG: hypothetical protein HY319_13275 [Armatimonadetes bacterium]|nr:hypothetical protein [Armatimonadota bacterium]
MHISTRPIVSLPGTRPANSSAPLEAGFPADGYAGSVPAEGVPDLMPTAHTPQAPPAPQADLPDQIRARLVQEARHWNAALPTLMTQHDDLISAGRDYALCALAQNPHLSAGVSGHFTARYLTTGLHSFPRSNELDNVVRAGADPVQQKAVAGQVARFADWTLAEIRKTEVPALVFNELYDTMAGALSKTGSAAWLSAEQLSTPRALLEGSLYSSSFKPDDDRRWREADSVVNLAIALAQGTGGRFETDWMFDWLNSQPEAGALHLRAALELGKPIPDTPMQATLDKTAEWAARETDHNYFYNQDWFNNRAHLLARAFDARGDAEGKARYAQKLLESTQVEDLKAAVRRYLVQGRDDVEGTPQIRIRAGDQQIGIGGVPEAQAPHYEPYGPSDRGLAVANLNRVYHHDFFEEAGDQAMLALADPAHQEAARAGFDQALSRGHGQFLVREVLGRFAQLAEIFPAEVPTAIEAFVDCVEKVISRGGDTAEDMTYYVDARPLSREQRMRLLEAEAKVLSEPAVGEADYPDIREASRVQKRGIVFYSLMGLLGEAPFAGELPLATAASLAQADSDVQKVFDYQDRSIVENWADWKESSPRARSALGLS